MLETYIRSKSLNAFIDEAERDSVKVLNRSNRAAIFNTKLFHKTDDCRSRGGDTNHRSNVTILFSYCCNR